MKGGEAVDKTEKESNRSRTGRARKPYVKPAYQREQIFETMALSCGKVQSTEGQCHHNRKNS